MSDPLDGLFPAHIAEVRSRADAALAATGYDGLVVHAGRPAGTFLDDYSQPFRVNPVFKQWVPVTDAPDCFLRYVPGSRPLLCFHQPADYWHQPPAVPTDPWIAAFDVRVIRDPEEAHDLAAGQGRIAFIGEHAADCAGWGFAAANPADLIAHLHFRRAIKTPYEVECMSRASLVAARGHRAAESAFRAGASEFEAHQAYCNAAGVREQELPYGNIVGYGRAAAVLHYQHLGRTRGGERPSFLIDAGAEFRGYAADITRTYAAADGEFAALVTRMEALELALCDRVRAGTDYRDIHLAAHHAIGAVLRESGLTTCDPETAIATGVTRTFFPHGIGHLLGLQVHDVAGLAADESGREHPRPEGHPYLRLTRRLEPGFVVTIEPGIYFIDLLLEEARRSDAGAHIRWDAVERLYPYGGIRVEDDVLCTASAPRNLTREAFAALSPS